MVKYQRCYKWRKGDQHKQNDVDVEEQDEEHGPNLALFFNSVFHHKNNNNDNTKKTTTPTRLKLFYLLLLSLFILGLHFFFCSSSAFSLLYSFGADGDSVVADKDSNASPCSSVPNGTICCDRSSIRTDVCIMKGDVRTHPASSSIFLYTTNASNKINQLEKIKPYTRKWETSVMSTIDELNLVTKESSSEAHHRCDVKHDVPAVFFSTGGYTGNVYHEFNDGILPLYITIQHLNKKVVPVILEYHDWWMMKYGDIFSQLSDNSPIDFRQDTRTHCFPEVIIGLKIHDELTVDPLLMEGNKSIVDFHNLLDRAYWHRIKGLIEDEEREARERLTSESKETLVLKRLEKPKLIIVSRVGSRAITNEDLLVKLADEIGFQVEVLRPNKETELAKIYRPLNSSDVMIGVHGAAMTHFLFMKPGSVFIQVIPLGTEWAAETYYGEPAKKLGLKYIGYRILAKESSLYQKYDHDDPILRDPASISNKGWQYTKSIYLESQNVTLNLGRFRKRLVSAHRYSLSRMRRGSDIQ